MQEFEDSNDTEQKLRQLLEPEFDPVNWLDPDNINDILKIVKLHGGPREGDIFSCDGYLDRRRLFSFALLSAKPKSVLEIGFNRGLSALLALTITPGMSLTCIDICTHAYVEPIHRFMSGRYVGRTELIRGDSRDVFRSIREQHYDVYVIDGGHGLDCCYTDLVNCINHARQGSLIYIDDLDYAEISIVVDCFIVRGMLTELSLRSSCLTSRYSSIFAVASDQYTLSKAK